MSKEVRFASIVLGVVAVVSGIVWWRVRPTSAPSIPLVNRSAGVNPNAVSGDSSAGHMGNAGASGEHGAFRSPLEMLDSREADQNPKNIDKPKGEQPLEDVYAKAPGGAPPSLSDLRIDPVDANASRSGENGTQRNTAMSNPGETPAAPDQTGEKPPKSELPPGMERYRVENGDTLASIAEMFYANEKLGSRILAANTQIKDPEHLVAGAYLTIPVQEEEASLQGASTHGKRTRSYRVQNNESFYSIAKSVLGDASRFQEIFDLNRDRVKGDPKKLRAGQEILLPVE